MAGFGKVGVEKRSKKEVLFVKKDEVLAKRVLEIKRVDTAQALCNV